eukprot:1801123-Rhodomonas_salina.1
MQGVPDRVPRWTVLVGCQREGGVCTCSGEPGALNLGLTALEVPVEVKEWPLSLFLTIALARSFSLPSSPSLVSSLPLSLPLPEQLLRLAFPTLPSSSLSNP